MIQPPAQLTWNTHPHPNLLTTTHNGTRWALAAYDTPRPAHTGRRTTDGDYVPPAPWWRLHKLLNPSDYARPVVPITAYAGYLGPANDFARKVGIHAYLSDAGPADRGYWIAELHQLERAKAVAACVATNPHLYDRKGLIEAARITFPDEVTP